MSGCRLGAESGSCEGKRGTATLAEAPSLSRSAGRNVASAPFTCRQRAAAGVPSALLSCRSQAGDVFAGRRARPFQAGARRGGRAAEEGGAARPQRP